MRTQPLFKDGAWIDPDAMIDVVVDGVAKLWPVAGLTRVAGGHDNENETVSWVEYRLGEATVHRSVDMRLKKAIFADGIAAQL